MAHFDIGGEKLYEFCKIHADGVGKNGESVQIKKISFSLICKNTVISAFRHGRNR
jgi:hypothetical protein